MISALHLVLAVGAHVALWRGLERASFAEHGPAPEVASAFALAVIVASVAGSAAALAAGRTAWSPTRALLWDGVSLAGAAWAIAVLSLGPWTRDLAGVVAVAVVVVRLAPGGLAIAGGRSPAWLAFLVAAGGYVALASWVPVASAPFGDQVHYLLVADRLAHGSIATPADPRLFVELIGVPPAAADDATHIALTPVGPRPVQGYALALAILPGWVLFGRVGAGIVLALIGAWTSLATFLILRDLRLRGALPPIATPRAGESIRHERERGRDNVVGWTWLMATALLPMALLATHEYPNMLGAALIATAFRWGFTAVDARGAPATRPALAAAVLALTLFLTPRDAVALVVLLPFLLRDRAARARVAVASVVVLLVVVISNGLLYGLPIPYASYSFGTSQAQELTGQGSLTAFLWVTLPAILFDRTFGIAGTAPWLFIGLVGVIPAVRADRAVRNGEPGSTPVLLPAALAVGVSVVALGFFRLWEGGYAPPARYFVDVLPLWMPFVAIGMGQAFEQGEGVGRLATRAFAIVVVAVSAITSLVLNAAPALALNSAFDDKIRDTMGKILGIDPLGWLPNFQPLTGDWYLAAYLRLLPAVVGAAALIVAGLTNSRSGRLMGVGMTAARQDDPSVDAPRSVGVPGNDPDPSAFRHPRRAIFGTAPDEAPHRGRSAAVGPMLPIRRSLVVDLLLLGVVLFATAQSWLITTSDPVPDSLYRKWLPLSLAFAALGTAFVARALGESASRAALLRRHYLLYLVPLGLMLIARFGEGVVVNGALGAVYLLIAAGFALNALAALWASLDRLSDRALAIQLGGIVLVAALVLLPYHRAVMPTASDEPHYLLVTQSLVYDRDLDLANDYAGDRYSAFYPSRLPDVHGVRVGSQVYSIRDLGLPILGVIPFAIAGRLGVLAMLCVFGAALAAQLFLLARDLGFARRVAFLAAATTALAHPLFTYTTQIYPELLTALAFVSLARLLRAGAATATRDVALASALLGTLPWLSTRAWPIVAGAGIALALVTLRPAVGRTRALAARSAAGALPFAALVLALAYLNWRTLGLFLPSAGYFLIREQQPVLAFEPYVGAPGLLFDRAFGLIPRAPVYLLAFLGVVPLLRRRAGHGAELAAVALGSILSFVYIADIAYWWADGSPPSRYLIGSLPLVVLAVAAGWKAALASRVARIAAALATAASAVVVYVYAALPNIRYDLAVDVASTGSSGGLFTFVERATGIDAGRLFPSLVRLDPLSVALALAWSAIAAALVAVGGRTQDRVHS